MLKDLKVAELREVADEFGVDHEGSKTKAALIAQLAEEGVTEAMYQSFKGGPEDEPKAEDSKAVKTATKTQTELLLKMNRENGTYEVLGHRFTREHPYVAVPVEDAQHILDMEEGFVQATPKELEEYYS